MPKDSDDTEKNENAVAMAALGAAKGGYERARRMTAEQRKEIAKTAAQKRWEDRPVRATHMGIIQIGDSTISCANLPDGVRLISEADLLRALGRSYSGYYSKRDRDANAQDSQPTNLPQYLSPARLKPYISQELEDHLSKPISYISSGTPGKSTAVAVAKGIRAEVLPKICKVWVEAHRAGVLLPGAQIETAERANIILYALAEVGIIALIDEATGYQDTRDRLALQALLSQYLKIEFAAWAQRFPEDFYKHIFRLRKWKWKGMSVNRPQAVAHYTNDIVYSRLAPGILEELQRRNPKGEKGHRRAKHHQFLTDDVGHPALAQHLHAVLALMRISDSWDQFMTMLNRAYPVRENSLQIGLFNEASD